MAKVKSGKVFALLDFKYQDTLIACGNVVVVNDIDAIVSTGYVDSNAYAVAYALENSAIIVDITK